MQCDKCFSLYTQQTGCLSCFNKDNPFYNPKYAHKGLYTGLMSSRDMIVEADYSEKQFARDVDKRLDKSVEGFKKILGTVISQKGY